MGKRFKKALSVMLVFTFVLSAVKPFDSFAASGWNSDEKGWWYENSDGGYATGWNEIDGYWYYFLPSGYMDYSEYRDGCWLNADGTWNTAYSGGYWASDSKGWWYTDSSGWYPVSTWLWIDGSCYYFKEDGYMAKDEWIGDAYLGSSGAWEKDRKKVNPNNQEIPKEYKGFLDKLISDYKKDYKNDDAKLYQLFGQPVSSYYGNAHNTCGYAVFDINNDGKKELILCLKDESYIVKPRITSIYTIINGEMKLLFSGNDRSPFYYLGNGEFLYAPNGYGYNNTIFLEYRSNKIFKYFNNLIDLDYNFTLFNGAYRHTDTSTNKSVAYWIESEADFNRMNNNYKLSTDKKMTLLRFDKYKNDIFSRIEDFNYTRLIDIQ